MTAEHSLRDLLHDATHRIPGVPAHVEHPPGHQGRRQGAARQSAVSQGAVSHGAVSQGAASPAPEHSPRPPQAAQSHQRSWNHSPSRPPRVLAAWQRRVGRFFGQEL